MEIPLYSLSNSHVFCVKRYRFQKFFPLLRKSGVSFVKWAAKRRLISRMESGALFQETGYSCLRKAAGLKPVTFLYTFVK